MYDVNLADFVVRREQLWQIAEKFRGEIEKSLNGKESSLKMLSSYLSPAIGNEQGSFLALDFGGTNVRLLEVLLQGQGRLTVQRKSLFPLRTEGVDYTAENTDSLQLFGYLAAKIREFVEPERHYRLGHTFSFPFSQSKANEAVLLVWTKEFKTCGVEGKNVTDLLSQALMAQGLSNVEPVAVLNDTVATLLAASYQYRHVTIGAICGTGHNSCYVERCGREPVIMNLESGNFSTELFTVWDQKLDQSSVYPGQQRLEKQVSAGYLGNLATLIARSVYAETQSNSAGFTGQDLADFLSAKSWKAVRKLAEERGFQLNRSECEFLIRLSRALVFRSARLAAASFCGILFHCDRDLQERHRIAVDGSLYEKMPGYRAALTEALYEIYGEKADQIQTLLMKDGSGMGAAVAAALASKRHLA